MLSRKLTFSRKSTRFLAAGIATIVIGAGTVRDRQRCLQRRLGAAATVPAATAGGGTRTGRLLRGVRIRRRRIERSIRPRRRRINRQGQQHVHVRLHPVDPNRWEGDHQGDIVHQIREGHDRRVEERCHQRQDRPRARNGRQHHDHRHEGHRGTAQAQLQDRVPSSRLQQRHGRYSQKPLVRSRPATSKEPAPSSAEPPRTRPPKPPCSPTQAASSIES